MMLQVAAGVIWWRNTRHQWRFDEKFDMGAEIGDIDIEMADIKVEVRDMKTEIFDIEIRMVDICAEEFDNAHSWLQ